MKTKHKGALYIVFTALLFTSLLFYNNWQKARKTNERLDRNFTILALEVKSFKKQVVTTGVLEMTKKEIKDAFPTLEKHLKDEFNAKLKNVQTYSNTQTIVNHTFETLVKDSLIKDTVHITTFEYNDKWLHFSAYKQDSSFIVTKNSMSVPLEQIIYRDKWKPKNLFKARSLQQTIKTENPFAVIEFQRTINLKK